MAQHVPFDVLGLSYYTFFHGPCRGLRDNLDDLATRYGKKIVIAESQYAWTLANGDGLGNFLWSPSQLVEPATRPRPAGRCRSSATCSRSWPRCRTGSARALLLGAGVDPGRRLGARRGHAQRQPDAVLVHRPGAALGRHVRGARSRCAPATRRRRPVRCRTGPAERRDRPRLAPAGARGPTTNSSLRVAQVRDRADLLAARVVDPDLRADVALEVDADRARRGPSRRAARRRRRGRGSPRR